MAFMYAQGLVGSRESTTSTDDELNPEFRSASWNNPMYEEQGGRDGAVNTLHGSEFDEFVGHGAASSGFEEDNARRLEQAGLMPPSQGGSKGFARRDSWKGASFEEIDDAQAEAAGRQGGSGLASASQRPPQGDGHEDCEPTSPRHRAPKASIDLLEDTEALSSAVRLPLGRPLVCWLVPCRWTARRVCMLY